MHQLGRKICSRSSRSSYIDRVLLLMVSFGFGINIRRVRNRAHRPTVKCIQKLWCGGTWAQNKNICTNAHMTSILNKTFLSRNAFSYVQHEKAFQQLRFAEQPTKVWCTIFVIFLILTLKLLFKAKSWCTYGLYMCAGPKTYRGFSNVKEHSTAGRKTIILFKKIIF